MISSDNNLLLKAKENGLVHRKMPETYLIKEELSEEEKEIKALREFGISFVQKSVSWFDFST
ncbi:hypothetical protein, partial [Phocaeicola coprocola]|uniref:hypothetical protein n=1 Tax=Phocaeicola coprocola TaxID=310298 RepID=UPI001C702BA9